MPFCPSINLNNIAMKKCILVCFGLLIGVFACSGGGEHPYEMTNRLNFLNWSYYIADETIPEFEEEFGVRVRYDNFSSNDELLTKIKTGGRAGYDLIVPSDYMVEIMINLGLLHEINYDNIPNIVNIDPRFRNMPFDPEGRYSVPYQWGTAGIAVNTRFIEEEVTSWDILWDPKYAGRIAMLDDMRSGMVPALKRLGFSVNTTDPDEINQARDLLIQQKPLVRAYTSDTYIDLLKSGDVWLAYGWSGDIYQVARENPDVIYIIPEEGTYVWVDNLAIPKNAKNRFTAEIFINYLLRPEVSAEISNYTWYSSPNTAAKEFIEDHMLNDPGVYPSDEVLDRAEFMRDVGEATRLYNRAWLEVKTH
jgi:spermidine/putrescine transport system substrate-binding protein